MKTPFLTACHIGIRAFLVHLFGQTLHRSILALAYGLNMIDWVAQARKKAIISATNNSEKNRRPLTASG